MEATQVALEQRVNLHHTIVTRGTGYLGHGRKASPSSEPRLGARPLLVDSLVNVHLDANTVNDRNAVGENDDANLAFGAMQIDDAAND